LMDDDFEATQSKLNWDTISDQYLSQKDRLILRNLQGNELGELLAPDSDIKAIFDDDEESMAVASSFIKVLELRSPEQLKYILLLLSTILRNDDRRGQVFLSAQAQDDADSNIISSFSRVWLRNDISSFCQGKAAICAAIILRWLRPVQNDQFQWFESLNSFILSQFLSSKNDQLLSPLLALKGIIRNEYFQKIFHENRGVEKLSQILFENDNHRQVIYLTVYNLWALTFSHYEDDDARAEQINQYKRALLNGELIHKMVKFVREKKSTKISRVTLALFENLTNFENFNEMVVLFGIFPVVESMDTEEKAEDEELKSSVKNLLLNLEKSVKILSSFERYEQEVKTSKLIWGPTHTESFWKKYCHKLEDDNYKLIRCLIKLLDSKDTETVAVACYDIGEWSRFYPDAKPIIEKLKGKYKLMSLIEHFDEDICNNALNAVQKLLTPQSLNGKGDDNNKNNNSNK